ncbi:MAG: peptidoglycan editing factor PgeF [Ostreibacterium sp.]
MPTLPVIMPEWDAPKHVVAFTTTTSGGVSQGHYHSLNVGHHVGDNPSSVNQNRACLQQHVGYEVQLCWLNQTHSDTIINLSDYDVAIEADAAVTIKKNQACMIMTADCLPVLLCNKTGTKVAALHCGWRGLEQNLIGKTLSQYFDNERIVAWLGPAIGQKSYEVNEKLYQRFVMQDKIFTRAFSSHRIGHYLFDLSEIARRQLYAAGVPSDAIYGGGFDTFTDSRFFSYRQNNKTGRLATIIYLT